MSRWLFCFSIAAAGAFPGLCNAGELPLWEVGLGVAGLEIPDYRGADESRGYVFPLPYVQLRGSRLRIDREGMHGNILRTGRTRLELSVSAGVPVKSDRNRARTGMPDLDPTFEAGPLLEILLGPGDARTHAWSVRLPVRAVIATDLKSFNGVGWVFDPHLYYSAVGIGPGNGWDLGLALGPIYGGKNYHEYYYTVAPQFATPERAAYDAPAGYSGSRMTLTASRRYRTYWIGAFVRYDNLSGAAFRDSPLSIRNSSLMAGAGVAWILATSRTPARNGPAHSH